MSILQQLVEEARKKEINDLKNLLKTDLENYIKTKRALENIVSQMEDKLSKAGSVENIREILGSL